MGLASVSLSDWAAQLAWCCRSLWALFGLPTAASTESIELRRTIRSLFSQFRPDAEGQEIGARDDGLESAPTPGIIYGFLLNRGFVMCLGLPLGAATPKLQGAARNPSHRDTCY